jgi:hypothetical protein
VICGRTPGTCASFTRSSFWIWNIVLVRSCLGLSRTKICPPLEPRDMPPPPPACSVRKATSGCWRRKATTSLPFFTVYSMREPGGTRYDTLNSPAS